MSDFSKAGGAESLRIRRLRVARILEIEAALVAELIERGVPRDPWVAVIASDLPSGRYVAADFIPRAMEIA